MFIAYLTGLFPNTTEELDLYYRLADEAAATSEGMDGRRLGEWLTFTNGARSFPVNESYQSNAITTSVMCCLALAHMQTMVLHEQRVVNNASAIGHTFTFEMLKGILPRMSEQDLITSLRSLVGGGIIKCASTTCDCKKNSKHNRRTGKRVYSLSLSLLLFNILKCKLFLSQTTRRSRWILCGGVS